MKIYSYLVKNDGGFAPNPFHGRCPLACCKPKIRERAGVGEVAFLKVGRGHRCRFEPKQIARVARWFDGLPRGVLGRPALWPGDDRTCEQRCG